MSYKVPVHNPDAHEQILLEIKKLTSNIKSLESDPEHPTDTLKHHDKSTSQDSNEPYAFQAAGLSNIDLLAVAAISLTVSLLVAFGAHFLGQGSLPNIGSVDMALVLEIQSASITSKALSLGATRTDQDAAARSAEKFGQNLEEALAQAAKVCGCTVLAKGAVLVGGTQDMTPVVLRSLGLDGLDLTELRSKISGAIANSVPGAQDLRGGQK